MRHAPGHSQWCTLNPIGPTRSSKGLNCLYFPQLNELCHWRLFLRCLFLKGSPLPEVSVTAAVPTGCLHGQPWEGWGNGAQTTAHNPVCQYDCSQIYIANTSFLSSNSEIITPFSFLCLLPQPHPHQDPTPQAAAHRFSVAESACLLDFQLRNHAFSSFFCPSLSSRQLLRSAVCLPYSISLKLQQHCPGVFHSIFNQLIIASFLQD